MDIINNIRFNQTKDCVSIATNFGFVVYSINPFDKKIECNMGSGFEIVQMLNNTNTFLLVGNGTNKKYPPNKLFLWNDFEKKMILDIEYNDIIKNIELRSDVLIVVLEYKTIVYELPSYRKIKDIITCNNPLGLVTINYSLNHNKKLRLITPNIKIGSISINDKYGLEPLRIINAHNNKLECIQLNNNGEYIATASNMGTIIRLFNINNGDLIKEFRRGSTTKIIFNLCFNQYSNLLLCNTKCGSIHLFETGLNSEVTDLVIPSDYIPSFLKYNWDISRYRIDGVLCNGCFNADNLIMISYDSKYYHFKYENGIKLYNIVNLFFGNNNL